MRRPRTRRAAYLGALATSLCLRPEDRHGLSTAVRLVRRAAAISAPDDVESLSNLAIMLLTSYRESGDPAQLNEAAEVLTQAAASVPADHPERPAVFTNQAAVLRSRFEVNGNHADLWLAVDAAGTALRSAARTDPDQALYRVNLAVALLTRFETTGRVRDLGQAVSLLRAAVASTAPGHADRAMRLSHLGLAVEMQVRTTGSSRIGESPLELTPNTPVRKSRGSSDATGRIPDRAANARHRLRHDGTVTFDHAQTWPPKQTPIWWKAAPTATCSGSAATGPASSAKSPISSPRQVSQRRSHLS